MHDFIIKCEEDQSTDGDWDVVCSLHAHSNTAKNKLLGYSIKDDVRLAYISLSHEKNVINSLKFNKKPVPKNTIILNMINKIVTNTNIDLELKGIGIKLLCSILSKLKNFDATHIYLIATSSDEKKLIAFYKKFGFVSDNTNPEEMVASVDDIVSKCNPIELVPL
jgi:hypothetical protein